MIGPVAVNSQLTVNTPNGGGPAGRSRRRSEVENDAYVAFCRRAIRAAGRRVAIGDVEDLPDLLSLREELDRAFDVAVAGLRAEGFSWGEIASRLGTSRQAAQQRWGSSGSPGGGR